MHLAELLERRTVPAAGVWFALTRRCPLRCLHCSTDSTATAPEHSPQPFLRLARTFTASDHPEFALFTGGEPLLRPDLVVELAETARAVGTRSYLLTGLFFARRGRIPAAVGRAVRAVDHLAVSVDRFHEREVPRRAVFGVLHRLLAEGRDVSLQIVSHDGDPYLEELTGEVRREFDDRVPMLVGRLAPAGRARQWLPLSRAVPEPPGAADPCSLAAWPVVRFDGVVVACGNQHALDAEHPPAHLCLGDAARDDWTAIRTRTFGSPALRAIRLYGPCHLATRHGGDAVPGDCCATCLRLPPSTGAAEAARPTTAALEHAVADLRAKAGATAFLRPHAIPRYAPLATLGHPDA
ncbi:radical SAM protein [Spongiactinospora sp. TRM90649]|uniref:radical SAM protein n=1 Tax=Spongiactinospora sp. TRM90649 TaxID=3031114 RepID=UPI0023FA34A7|nr:radical SAM protein [Spongiactinospora sp. TRM90649]MDF5759102.1 radical SAM protein [Spongiactinospora sp. TRM90649]